MKKYLPTITIFTIIIGIIALAIWFSEKDSSYFKQELAFLEKEGFLDEQGLVSKSSTLIEQNLNSPDESFEVLATRLDKTTYQLAFKLENRSNESKEFYLIPISKQEQAEFQEINGVVNQKNLLHIDKQDVQKQPLADLYNITEHKKQLIPELSQAYIDIRVGKYQAQPVKITLAPNSTLLAKSKWEIVEASPLQPVYLLVYGSAGGAKDGLGAGDPQAYEFLIRIEDKLTSKEGDCITFKLFGWDWGRMERQHYAILTIQDITYEQAKEWCSFEEEELTVYTEQGKEKTYHPKKYSFDLKDIAEDKKNDWKNQDKKVSPTVFDKAKIELKKDKDK